MALSSLACSLHSENYPFVYHPPHFSSQDDRFRSTQDSLTSSIHLCVFVSKEPKRVRLFIGSQVMKESRSILMGEASVVDVKGEF